MLQVSKCLIGLAVMVLQSCDVADNRRDQLCGNWESVEGKPDVLIYKEGEAYKVTVFKRSGLRRKLKPETYLLQEENGNLFMNTGFRIDVSYNEATDVLTFSPNGDYVRVTSIPQLQDKIKAVPAAFSTQIHIGHFDVGDSGKNHWISLQKIVIIPT